LSKIDLPEDEERRFAKIIIDHFSATKKIRGLVARDDQAFLDVLKSYITPLDTSPSIEETGKEGGGPGSKANGHENPDHPEQPVSKPPEEPGSSAPDAGSLFTLPEQFERFGATFRRITPPEREREDLFSKIKIIIEKSKMPGDLKEMAIKDLREAWLSYISGANKACVVMLGAVLEGVMISVVQNDTVLLSIRKNRPTDIALLKQCGIANTGVSVIDVKKNFTTHRFGFEEYRQIIIELLKDAPDVDKPKIGEIQTFRNIIHPLLNISQVAYRDIDTTRSLNLLSSMAILTKIILSILD
jgi:hypothetical protein